jgi:deoxyribose-phosphate aldolase
MNIEYYINTIDEKDIDIKKNLEDLINNTSIRKIIATHHCAKLIKKNFPNLTVGAFIDYPVANCESYHRHSMIQDAIKYNIDYIAITLPFYYLVNRKYDKIREDIKKNLDICENREIRYILEYRKFDHQILAKACEILLSSGINIVYPSSGFFLDSLDDNIVACGYLHNKTSINTIINGNVWTQQHIKQILKSNMYGFSCNNILALKLIP